MNWISSFTEKLQSFVTSKFALPDALSCAFELCGMELDLEMKSNRKDRPLFWVIMSANFTPFLVDGSYMYNQLDGLHHFPPRHIRRQILLHHLHH